MSRLYVRQVLKRLHCFQFAKKKQNKKNEMSTLFSVCKKTKNKKKKKKPYQDKESQKAGVYVAMRHDVTSILAEG